MNYFTNFNSDDKLTPDDFKPCGSERGDYIFNKHIIIEPFTHQTGYGLTFCVVESWSDPKEGTIHPDRKAHIPVLSIRDVDMGPYQDMIGPIAISEVRGVTAEKILWSIFYEEVFLKNREWIDLSFPEWAKNMDKMINNTDKI